MKFSIATVSLGGALPEKLAAIAARRLRGRRDLRGRRAGARGPARRDRPHGPRPRPRDRRLPAVPRLRGHARAAARARLRAGAAQVRADERARRRPHPRLLQRLAGGARRHRPRRGRPRELGDIAAGFGVEVGFEALAWGRHVSRLPRRLGGRAPRRPPPRRADPRQLARAGARAAGRPDPRDPGRPHHLRAARRRAGDGHGPPAVVAALPQLPRPGRPARRRLHGGGAAPPATTAGSASRSSTTASAWPRRGGSPRTASAR